MPVAWLDCMSGTRKPFDARGLRGLLAQSSPRSGSSRVGIASERCLRVQPLERPPREPARTSNSACYPRRSGTSCSTPKNASPSRASLVSCLDCSTVSIMASLVCLPVFTIRMISPGTGWKQLSRGVSAVLPVTTASKFHPVGSSRPSPALQAAACYAYKNSLTPRASRSGR